jgi:quercetin dioxygenase-like cupin family protein/DNA-binding Xre family transcriptional regulator
METERLLEVGRKLRYLRRQRGLTLRSLSEQCGLSVGFLSQIERGLSSFSIPSLRAICGALDVALADMLVMSNGPGKAFLADPRPAAITKGDNRSYVSLSDTSVKYRFLSAEFPGRRFEVLIGEMAQGSSHESHVHEGEEFGYILDGGIDLTIAEEEHHLGAGDSYHLLAATSHRCAAAESGAKVLWVQTARYAKAIALLGAELPDLPGVQEMRAPLLGGDDGADHVKLSDSTVTYRFLSGTLPAGSLEVLVAEIPSGFSQELGAYEGEEFGFVLEGRIQLTIGEEGYALGSGDCYHLPALSHRGCATTQNGGAKLLLARSAVGSIETERAWQAATENSLQGTTGVGHPRPRPSGGSNV